MHFHLGQRALHASGPAEKNTFTDRTTQTAHDSDPPRGPSGGGRFEWPRPGPGPAGPTSRGLSTSTGTLTAQRPASLSAQHVRVALARDPRPGPGAGGTPPSLTSAVTATVPVTTVTPRLALSPSRREPVVLQVPIVLNPPSTCLHRNIRPRPLAREVPVTGD
jgi:hypothetical protein